MATRDKLIAQQARERGKQATRRIRQEAAQDKRDAEAGKMDSVEVEAPVVDVPPPVIPEPPTDNHQPSDSEWSEPKPQQPTVGTTDFTRLDIARAIHSPRDGKMWEMSRVPAGMVMTTILMRLQEAVVLHPELHPMEHLLRLIAEGFRGLDGKLIKDMVKLFEVESDKGSSPPMGGLIR